MYRGTRPGRLENEMLTILAAAVVLGNQQSAGSLVSKMLAKYNAAPSLVGKIVLTQSAQGKSVTTETLVQYERPAKVFVRQNITVPAKRIARIISDGKVFAYTLPEHLINNNYDLLKEPVKRETESFDVGRIYITGSASLQDNSAPLAIAFGRLEDLKFLRGQWATVEAQGTTEIEGKTINLVGGDWRQYEIAPVSARYQMAITNEGDLLRYSIKESVVPAPSLPVVEIHNLWVSKLEVGAKPDQALFAVP